MFLEKKTLLVIEEGIVMYIYTYIRYIYIYGT